MEKTNTIKELSQFSIEFVTKEGDTKNGPLALLWHLIESYEVDIFNVSLKRITEDFSNYIIENDIPLEEKSDFALMGARLIFYKSRKLIPSDDIDDDYETDTLPLELVEQLLQYKKFQAASENLRSLENSKNLTISRISTWQDYEKEGEVFLSVDLMTLLSVFKEFLLAREKEPSMEIEEEEINTEIILEEIRKKLSENIELSFFIFVQNFTIIKIIACFLSILELAKMREIIIFQNTHKDDILLKNRI
ncbi:MAG: segregation/condensation protein A [Spirochaetia bacterium]|nr:segregation/condensation protein A [Spirochaetia bacterium]